MSEGEEGLCGSCLRGGGGKAFGLVKHVFGVKFFLDGSTKRESNFYVYDLTQVKT